MSSDYLVIEDIVAGYVPGVNILNGCTLDIEQGELIGIIGPNGAGKSTMLKTLFGLLKVRSGRLDFKGTSIIGSHAHQLVSSGIGFVPQTENVFATLTVKENLEMGSFLRSETFDDRFGYVTEMFPRLRERSDQRAGLLSGGERQMLAMARALMMSPEILLLDEPSAGLSPDLQDQVFVNTKKINASGVTIIMVEQNAHRCLQICDRAYVLDQGKDAHSGTGQELLRDPRVIELYLGDLGESA